MPGTSLCINGLNTCSLLTSSCRVTKYCRREAKVSLAMRTSSLSASYRSAESRPMPSTVGTCMNAVFKILIMMLACARSACA